MKQQAPQGPTQHPQQQQQQLPHDVVTPFRIGQIAKKSKTAPSAYVTFCRDKRAEIKAQYPTAGIAEQGRILGQMWNALDKDTKQV